MDHSTIQSVIGTRADSGTDAPDGTSVSAQDAPCPTNNSDASQPMREKRIRETADSLVACEIGRFSACGYRGLLDAPEFEIVEGTLPVLISAPHAVTHIREGAIKASEDFTGAIALTVAERAGCHAIMATRTGTGDPNWDAYEDSPYKQALCAHVRSTGVEAVFDLHGMVAASASLIAIGSSDGETTASLPGLDSRVTDMLRDRLSAWVRHYGKPITLNGSYAARRDSTVARTVARECDVAALQIEIATQLRVPASVAKQRTHGEPIPFSSRQLPVELQARAAANPKAVSDLIDALCAATRLAVPS